MILGKIVKQDRKESPVSLRGTPDISSVSSQFENATPEVTQLKRLQDSADNSNQVHQLMSFQNGANRSSQINQIFQLQQLANTAPSETIQKKSNDARLENTSSNNKIIQREVGEGEASPENAVESAEPTTATSENINPETVGEEQAFSDKEIEAHTKGDQENESTSGIMHIKEMSLGGSQYANLAKDTASNSEGAISSGAKFADNADRGSSFIDRLKSSLEGIKAIPIFSIVLNLKTFKDLYFEYYKKKRAKKAFAKLKQEDDKKGKTSKKTSVGHYAYAKSFRGFVDTCVMVGVEFVDIVGNILALIGSFINPMGAAVAAGVVKTVTGGIKSFRSALQSIKGIVKFLMGKRGKNRSKNATKLVSEARGGDIDSAQAICDLKTKTLKEFNNGKHPETAEETIDLLVNINRNQLSYNAYSKEQESNGESGFEDDEDRTISKSIMADLTKEIAKLMRSKSDV